MHEIVGGEVIDIDGKRLRRSHDRVVGKGALYMLSAWAVQSRVVLGSGLWIASPTRSQRSLSF